jgi:hypothetical protein
MSYFPQPHNAKIINQKQTRKVHALRMMEMQPNIQSEMPILPQVRS